MDRQGFAANENGPDGQGHGSGARASASKLRRYTFKIYPRPQQAAALDRMRRLHCQLYNAALQERIDAYRLKGLTLTLYDQSKSLKLIRRDNPEFAAMSFDSAALTLARLDAAMKAFFRRAKIGAGAQSGFPRFKRSDDYPGFTMPSPKKRPGGKLANAGWRLDRKPNGGLLYIKGIKGLLRARGKFPVEPEALKTCTITLQGGAWWASIVAEMPARLRCDQSYSGEIRFNLVDHFATVRVADGRHAAGPEETVYIAANGRIGCISDDLTKDRSELSADCGPTVGWRMRSSDRKSSELSADCGPTVGPQAVGCYAGPSELSADCGPTVGTSAGGLAAELPELSADCGPTVGFASETFDRIGSELSANCGPTVGPIPCAVSSDESELSADCGPTVGTHQGCGGKDGSELSADCGPTVGLADTYMLGSASELSADCEPTVGFGRLPMTEFASELSAIQRRISRCKRGSARYRRLRRLKAKLESRSARRRRESLHVWTTELARRFAELRIVAPASIAETTQSGRGDKYEWGAAVETKATLNRLILDQAPSLAISMLEYKLAERGGKTERIADTAPPAIVGNAMVDMAKAKRRTKRAIKRNRSNNVQEQRTSI